MMKATIGNVWLFDHEPRQVSVTKFDRRDRCLEELRIRMRRAAQHIACRPFFHHRTAIHHNNPVSECLGDRDVMRDEKQRQLWRDIAVEC
jgi:hypothetical protein